MARTSQPFFRAWDDAPAFLLSCPGPLRHHHAAVQPIAQLGLPQCLLGSEAQLLAFAAAHPDQAPRMFFVPLPEMFASPASLHALAEACGVALAGATPRLVHLRFGGTRSTRVLKDARNGLVLAENHKWPPITASRHPFAGGLTVPASLRRVFSLDAGNAIPSAIGGAALPVTLLDGDYIGADLALRHEPQPDRLDIISLAEFRSNAWAAGTVRAVSADLATARRQAARDGAPFVLLPWNLDHPGSPVPLLIARTLRLQHRHRLAVRLVIAPFNYPGQTGLIRRLVRSIRQTVDNGGESLAQLFLARVTHPAALPALLDLARVAWVDGNDPEHDWTTRRLAAAGFSPMLLAADSAHAPDAVTIEADDAVTVEAETRFGLLHFHSKLPSLRALRIVLGMTNEVMAGLAPPAPVRRRRRA